MNTSSAFFGGGGESSPIGVLGYNQPGTANLHPLLMNRPMTNPRSGDAIVAESFLDVRAKLLEIAATFDRIDRGSEGRSLGQTAQSQRDALATAAKILLDDSPNRAEQLQQLFSREYEPSWRDSFGFKDN